MHSLFSQQRSKKIILILAVVLGLYAIVEFSGYGTLAIFQNEIVNERLTVTCALEFSDKTNHQSELSAKRHPEIVIRNQGPTTVKLVNWESKVFRYDSKKDDITALAIQGSPDGDNTLSGKEIIPSDELRYPTIGLSGDSILTIYIIRIDYHDANDRKPFSLESFFVVENNEVHPNSQFKNDPRYDHLLHKLSSFKQKQTSMAASGKQTNIPADPSPANAIKKVIPPGAEKQNPLYLQVFYVYRAGGRGPLRSIEMGEELKSGDHYKIYFRASRDCYTYVYQLDANGKVFRLFPMDQFDGVALHNENPVKAGSDYVLPSKDRFFYLDDVVGKEQILFAAFLQQNLAIEKRDRILQDAIRLNKPTQASNAGKELAEYLTAGNQHGNIQTMISPVAWQVSDSASPVSGYLIESTEGRSIQTVDFFHR